MKYQALGLLLILVYVVSCRSSVPAEHENQQRNSKVYVANSGSNSISVIDVNSDEVIKTIPTGEEPVSMAFSPDQTILAVANKTSKDIWLIDTKEDMVISKFPLANEFIPLRLVFGNANLLLVAVINDRHQRYIVSVDILVPTQLDTIAGIGNIGIITEMIVSRRYQILCVTGEIDNAISEYTHHNEPGTVISYKSRQVLMRATTNGFGAVITPDERYIYVNNLLGNFLKWDVETHTVEVFEEIVTHAGDMVFKDSDEIEIFYRVYPDNPMLTVVSLKDTTYKIYPLPYGGEYLVLSNAKDRLYIVHKKRNEVSVYDLSTKSVVKIIPVGSSPNDILILEDIRERG